MQMGTPSRLYILAHLYVGRKSESLRSYIVAHSAIPPVQTERAISSNSRVCIMNSDFVVSSSMGLGVG